MNTGHSHDPQPGGTLEVRALSFVLAAGIVVVATIFGAGWVVHLWPTKIPLMFLAAVLLAGHRLGMWPALFAAVLAFLSYNFFFEEPRFTLTIDAEDVFALTTFLVGALLVGGLTGRLSDHARRLQRALRQMTSLFEANRDLSVDFDARSAADRLVRHLQRGGCHAAIWIGAESDPCSGDDRDDLPADLAQALRLFRSDAAIVDRVAASGMLMRLSAGGRTIGVAAVWPMLRRPLPDARWLRALLDLGALAIDRGRLVGEIADARVVAEREGLRTALLSSLSHDLRTPLAAILASATSLLEYDGRFDVAARRELLVTIQEESERLNRYLGNLLEMTRLESGALQIARTAVDPREAMASALRRLQHKLGARPVMRDFAADCRVVVGDPVLIEQALMNVIENAAAHTPARAAIRASVQNVADGVLLTVEDDGDGIAPGELAHVFDKFYRGRSDRRKGAGVGLGLAVTRGLVEAFGGRVCAVSPVREGRGTRIEIELPAATALANSA